MGVDYWNLKARAECLHCGDEREDTLQTHWLGDYSFDHYYQIGEPVAELHGIQAATLDGVIDDFIWSCRVCKQQSSYGARIVDEAVVEIFPIKPYPVLEQYLDTRPDSRS